ncbi:AI-2E family transporter [Oryzihumus sp.]|uniref:AI-2E family transporter n=1 Tax=Oryzihumus sp. TaxID=1968903 RepID=UPI002ED91EA7
MWERWSEFRRRQRATLRESNRVPVVIDDDTTYEDPGWTETAEEPATDGEGAAPGPPPGPKPAPGTGPAPAPVSTPQPTPRQAPTQALPQYGLAGQPLNRHSPFYVGFVGAFGVLIAYALYNAFLQLTQVFTLLLVALFLTLALNPLVEWLVRRGLPRALAVTVVFLGLAGVFVAVGFLVVPPVAEQGGALAQSAPGYLDSLLNNKVVKDLDSHYHVIQSFQHEFQKRVTDSNFMSQVFGGVLGAGRAVLTGFFAFFTVLILTLYFLASLPQIKHAAYAMVPASRRPRFISLSEEIMRRVGSYAIGQVAVAAVNAFCSWIMMTIVGIPYAAVLAVAVGLLGLVPLVGASLGAAVVCTVAFFDEPKKAVIALVYYVVYQQIENYVVAPRIMQRTVSVPGAITIIAALIGGTLLGMLGALLAIPVAAGMLLIYEEVLLPRQRRA